MIHSRRRVPATHGAIGSVAFFPFAAAVAHLAFWIAVVAAVGLDVV